MVAPKRMGKRWKIVTVKMPEWWIAFLKSYVEMSEDYDSIGEIIREALWEWLAKRNLNPCKIAKDFGQYAECIEETKRALSH